MPRTAVKPHSRRNPLTSSNPNLFRAISSVPLLTSNTAVLNHISMGTRTGTQSGLPRRTKYALASAMKNISTETIPNAIPV
jgi:hypothetical protein